MIGYVSLKLSRSSGGVGAICDSEEMRRRLAHWKKPASGADSADRHPFLAEDALNRLPLGARSVFDAYRNYLWALSSRYMAAE